LPRERCSESRSRQCFPHSPSGNAALSNCASALATKLLVPSKKWVIFSILHVSASDRLRKRQKKNYAITAGQTFLKSIWIPLRSSIDNILVPRKNKLSRPSLWRILVIVKPEIKTEITRINYKACFS